MPMRHIRSYIIPTLIILVFILSSATQATINSNSYSNNIPIIEPITFKKNNNNSVNYLSIVIIMDTRTGYEIFAQQYKELLRPYFSNITIVNLPDILTGDVRLDNKISAMIVDPSVGSLLGASVNITEAKAILNAYKPTLLMGSAHGVIDRFENIDPASFSLDTIKDVTVANDFQEHQLFNRPFNVNISVDIFTDSFKCDTYKTAHSDSIKPILLSLQNNDTIILGTYSRENIAQKIVWFALENPTLLTDNGKNLFINTVSWLAYESRLSLIIDAIQNLQILTNSLFVGYGSFVFSKTPSIKNTYYYTKTMYDEGWGNKIEKQAIVNYIMTLFYEEQGYFEDIDTQFERYSKIETIGFAVETLYLLDYLSEIDWTKTIDFIKNCQGSEGGFNDDPNSTGTEDIYNTWAALKALKRLDPLFNSINVTQVVTYIKNLQDLDIFSTTYGGFKSKTSSWLADIKSSYYAVDSLIMLGKLDEIDANALSIFINNCESSDGQFKNSPVSTSYATAEAVWILYKINRLYSLDNATNTINKLRQSQQVDGGFGDNPEDYYTELETTSRAIDALSILNSEPINVTNVLYFLNNSITVVGGAANNRLIGDLWQTYSALRIINMSGMLNNINVTAVKIFLNKTYYTEQKNYFLFTAFYNGTIFRDLVYYALFFSQSGNILNYFAIKGIQFSEDYEFLANIEEDISQEILNSQVKDHISKYNGMFKRSTDITIPNDYNTKFDTTIFSTLSLDELNKLGNMDKLATRQYINETYVNSSYPKALYSEQLLPLYNQSYELFTTYYVLEVLRKIGGINQTILQYANQTVFDHINYESITNLYFSVKILEILQDYNFISNFRDCINVSRVLDLIKAHQRDYGLITQSDCPSFYLEETAMSVELLISLRILDLFDDSMIIDSNIIPPKNNYMLGETIVITGNSSLFQYNEPLENATICVTFQNTTVYEFTDSNGSFLVQIPLNDSKYVGEHQLSLNITYDKLLPSYFITDILVNMSIEVEVTTDKTEYRNDENITAYANVTTLEGDPVNDAIVYLDLIEINQTIVMEYIGNGMYQKIFPIESYTGNLSLHVTATHNYTLPAEDVTSIFVYNKTVVLSVQSNASTVIRPGSIQFNITAQHQQVDLNGTVYVYLDGINIENVTLQNNEAIYLLEISTEISLGTHNITFVFIPELTRYDTASYDCSFFVMAKPEVQLSLSNNSIYTIETTEITVKALESDDTINVSIEMEIIDINTNDTIVAVTGKGELVYQWNTIYSGNYKIIAKIIGNDTIIESIAEANLTVFPQPTEVIIHASQTNCTVNETIEISVIVNASNLDNCTINENENVYVYVNDTPMGIYNQKYVFAASISGTYLVTVTYMGNETFAPSSDVLSIKVSSNNSGNNETGSGYEMNETQYPDHFNVEQNATLIVVRQSVEFKVKFEAMKNECIPGKLSIFIQDHKMQVIEPVDEEIILIITFNSTGSFNISFVYSAENGTIIYSDVRTVTVVPISTLIILDAKQADNMIKVTATITTTESVPLQNVKITIKVIWPDGFSETKSGKTDQNGSLTINFEARIEGNITIVAEFVGNEEFGNSASITTMMVHIANEQPPLGIELTLGSGLIVGSLISIGIVYKRFKKFYKVFAK